MEYASERDVALDWCERRAALLRQVENALQRIVVGEYSVCVDCREPISEKRLVARPWAALCVDCQEAADNRDEVWCVIAFGVLIWTSLLQTDDDLLPRGSDTTPKACLDYVVISPALLSEWEAHQSNLILIDLRAKTDSGRNGDAIAGSLSIPVAALPTQPRWIPAATRLIFSTKIRLITSMQLPYACHRADTLY